MSFIYSKHALEQMKLRGISLVIIEAILAKPEQVTREAGKTVFQSIVNFIDEGNYLGSAEKAQTPYLLGILMVIACNRCKGLTRNHSKTLHVPYISCIVP